MFLECVMYTKQIRLWSQEIHGHLSLAALIFLSIWCGFRYGLTLWLWWRNEVAPQINLLLLGAGFGLGYHALLLELTGSSNLVDSMIRLQSELFWGGKPAGKHSPVLVVGFGIHIPPPLVYLLKAAHPGVGWLQGCRAAHFSNTLQMISQPHGDAPCWPNSNILAVSPIPVLMFLIL